jgi:hypothetical protein
MDETLHFARSGWILLSCPFPLFVPFKQKQIQHCSHNNEK